MIQLLKKRWVYHTLIWITIYLSLTLLSYIAPTNIDSFQTCLKEPFLFFLPVIPTVYLSFAAKQYLFDRRRYLLGFIAAILIIIFGVFLYELVEIFTGETQNSKTQNVINLAFLQLFALGLQYFKRGIINQYQVQELKAKNAVIELDALKAQLNPHFLFNTLNNIYGINQMDASKGSEMIMELSDVMRYHLEFSKVGKVRLEDEIELITHLSNEVN